MMGLGSLTFALPHFITDDYLGNVSQFLSDGTNSTSTNGLCSATRPETSDAAKEMALEAMRALVAYKYFFIFGQILHGIGAAPLITLGTTFLDENVNRVSAPLYIGIFQVLFHFKNCVIVSHLSGLWFFVPTSVLS